MTTTTGRTDLRAIESDIHHVRAAIASNETPLDADLRAKMTERFGAERIAQMDADTVVYLDGKRAELAALEAERAEAGKVACRRCFGDGKSPVPTTINAHGKYACFACGGSGLNSAARKARK
jgi:hypothetical protein